MKQVLTVTVPVQIPDGMKLVPDNCHGYEGETLTGRTWIMKDLRAWCGNKDVTWIKDNILFNPIYHNDMAEMERLHELIRPKAKGSPWKFKASVMAAWLDKHWQELPW